MKRKRKPKDGNVDTANIVGQERSNHISWHLTDSEKAIPESPGKKMIKRKVRRTREDGEQSSTKTIGIGDKVKVLTKRLEQHTRRDVRSSRKESSRALLEGCTKYFGMETQRQ
jgi:hypothetical protein